MYFHSKCCSCYDEDMVSSAFLVRSLNAWLKWFHSCRPRIFRAAATAFWCFSSSLISGRRWNTSVLLEQHIKNMSPVASSQAMLYFFLCRELKSHHVYISYLLSSLEMTYMLGTSTMKQRCPRYIKQRLVSMTQLRLHIWVKIQIHNNRWYTIGCILPAYRRCLARATTDLLCFLLFYSVVVIIFATSISLISFLGGETEHMNSSGREGILVCQLLMWAYQLTSCPKIRNPNYLWVEHSIDRANLQFPLWCLPLPYVEEANCHGPYRWHIPNSRTPKFDQFEKELTCICLIYLKYVNLGCFLASFRNYL